VLYHVGAIISSSIKGHIIYLALRANSLSAGDDSTVSTLQAAGCPPPSRPRSSGWPWASCCMRGWRRSRRRAHQHNTGYGHIGPYRPHRCKTVHRKPFSTPPPPPPPGNVGRPCGACLQVGAEPALLDLAGAIGERVAARGALPSPLRAARPASVPVPSGVLPINENGARKNDSVPPSSTNVLRDNRTPSRYFGWKTPVVCGREDGAGKTPNAP
jgi:hypothetical protein